MSGPLAFGGGGGLWESIAADAIAPKSASVLQILVPVGSTSKPNIGLATETNTGIFLDEIASGRVVFTHSGVGSHFFEAGQYHIYSLTARILMGTASDIKIAREDIGTLRFSNNSADPATVVLRASGTERYIEFQYNGNKRGAVSDVGLNFPNYGSISWASSTTNHAAGRDIYLYRGGPGILEQRNATNAQAFRVYGTWTDASNYERGSIYMSGALYIAHEVAGTGVAQDIILRRGGSNRVTVGANYTRFTDYVTTDAGGYGIGVNNGLSQGMAFSGTTTIIRTGLVGGVINLGDPGGANYITVDGDARLIMTTSGVAQFTDAAGTNFDKIILGAADTTGTSLVKTGSGHLAIRNGITSAYGWIYTNRHVITEVSPDVNAIDISGYKLRTSTTAPGIKFVGEWDTSGDCEGILFCDIADTASGAGSLLIDMQVGSSSKFRVAKSGSVTTEGRYGFGAVGGIRSGGADGVITLFNNAETDFGLLQFGGTTSSYPAFARVNTLLHLTTAAGSGASGMYGSNWAVGYHSSSVTASQFELCVGIDTIRARLTTPADGIVTITDSAGTDFDRVQLGGTSNLFPALGHTSARLDVKVADFTNWADIGCGALGAFGGFNKPGLVVSSYNLTGSATSAALHITGTWNTSGVVEGLIYANITDTASNAVSLLMDLQVGSTSQFRVGKGGSGYFRGAIETLSATIRPVQQTDPLTLNNLAMTRSSGEDNRARTYGAYNQTGTAGSTDLLLYRIDTALGSGSHYFLRCEVDGGGDKFYITTGGSVLATEYAGNKLNPVTHSTTLFLNTQAMITADNAVEMALGTFSSTSGANSAVAILPTYNQLSGTSANTDLLINRTETAVGSGAQLLFDAQVAGSSKVSIDRTGSIVTAVGGNLSLGGYLSVGSLYFWAGAGGDVALNTAEIRGGSGSTSQSLYFKSGNATNIWDSAPTVGNWYFSTEWDHGASTFTGIEMDITDTASNAASLLMSLGVGGTPKFIVDKLGGITVSSNLLMAGTNLNATGSVLAIRANASTTELYFGHNTTYATATDPIFLGNVTITNSSGVTNVISITPTYVQTSTAGATDLLINRVETAVGSGAQLLLDAQVGGSSKFKVTTTGAVTAAQTIVSLANVQVGAVKLYQWSGRSNMSSPSDGVIAFTNAAATDFLRLQFGGTTNAFPALKRNGTQALYCVRADDSNYTPFYAGQLRVYADAVNEPLFFGQSGSLTGSSAVAFLDFSGTWNTSGTPTAFLLNITDTASNGSSLLMDLQVGGADRFKVGKDGAVEASGNIQTNSFFRAVSGRTNLFGNGGASSGAFQFAVNASSSTTYPQLLVEMNGSDKLNAASGVQVFMGLEPVYNQTVSAGSTDFLINRTETVLGSGAHNFMVCQAGVTGGTTLFRIRNNGAVYIGASGRLTLTSTGVITTNTSNQTITMTSLGRSSAGNMLVMNAGAFTHSSGEGVGFLITSTANQSSTASQVDLVVDRTHTAVGSGAQHLLALREGGTDKFSVSRTGIVNFVGTDGAGASTGTLGNAPGAADPAEWIPVEFNGTTRYIPAWA